VGREEEVGAPPHRIKVTPKGERVETSYPSPFFPFHPLLPNHHPPHHPNSALLLPLSPPPPPSPLSPNVSTIYSDDLSNNTPRHTQEVRYHTSAGTHLHQVGVVNTISYLQLLYYPTPQLLNHLITTPPPPQLS
jgi:hypothetical protein